MADQYSYYTVQSGDTLFTIAQKVLGNGARYKEFMNWNSFIIDPNKIQVGWRLAYPSVEVASANNTAGVVVPPIGPAPSVPGSAAPSFLSKVLFKVPVVGDVTPVKAGIGVGALIFLLSMLKPKR